MPEWMPSLPLVIDLLFFAAILVLLHQLNRKVSRRDKILDSGALTRFERLIEASQGAADRLSAGIEAESHRLRRLAGELEEREKRLLVLLEAADTVVKRGGDDRSATTDPSSDGHAAILRMVREGLSREAIAQQTGFTAGEIDLVIDLDRAGRQRR